MMAALKLITEQHFDGLEIKVLLKYERKSQSPEWYLSKTKNSKTKYHDLGNYAYSIWINIYI